MENCKVDEYGYGVHEQCYVARLAHPNRKSLVELCALAAKEQDPQRLLSLVQEIDTLLEGTERLKKLG
jgi:hypothetical protein